MAFESNDGSKFGSRFKARKHDEFHSASTGKGSGSKQEMSTGKEGPDADTQERDTTEQQEKTSENPRETVQAHGPAHSVHVHHNRENKKHRVISHHDDGHMADSEYGSEKEAHDAAATLGGADSMPASSPDSAMEQSGDLMGPATSQGLA